MHLVRPDSRPARTHRRALLAALLAPLAGCYVWHTDPRPVTTVVRAAPEAQLRLRRGDGSVVVLREPRLVTDTSVVLGTPSDSAGASDTLVAGKLVARMLANGAAARGGGRRDAVVMVRVSDISRVEERRSSRWRTAAAIAAGVAFIAAPLVIRAADRSGQ